MENKCYYAFDPDDVNCANCDGVTMKIGESVIPCTKCPGYREMEEAQESVQETVQEEEKTDNVITLKEEEKTTESVQEHPTVVTDDYISKATTKSLKFMSGVSIEHDGVWYKFECTEEVEFSEGADVEKEKKLLWDKVNNEVDNQVKLVINP